jgi:ABC-type transport system involved in Fe-S cluster assembly fused permease/ATPase subunit
MTTKIVQEQKVALYFYSLSNLVCRNKFSSVTTSKIKKCAHKTVISFAKFHCAEIAVGKSEWRAKNIEAAEDAKAAASASRVEALSRLGAVRQFQKEERERWMAA